MAEVKSATTVENGLHTPPTDQPPPSYAVNDENAAPDLTAAFANLNLQSSGKPTGDQCIAHLKLLEAFHQFREDIALRDGLFGLLDGFVPPTLDERQRTEVLTKIREKRWAVFVTKAVFRFQRWWGRSIEPDAKGIRQADIPTAFKEKIHIGPALRLDQDHLPPLDIVMVWHAYLLNPRNVLEDCLRYGKLRFWRTGLPWESINSCINNDTFEYFPTTKTISNFEAATQCPWDSLADTHDTEMSSCPMCKEVRSIPWTRWNTKSAWITEAFEGKQRYVGEGIGTGLADKNFSFQCPCGAVIDHELLKVCKFRQDMEALGRHDIPMAGTLLDIDGLPKPPSQPGFLVRHPPLFPNRLICGPERVDKRYDKILEETTAVRIGPNRTMSDVRSVIEQALADTSHLKRCNRTSSGLLTSKERISIRRMMSCYWDNHSAFSLDLVGAVIRQGAFIEKMHAIDWIHSPTVTSTMRRLLVKYDRYFSILKAHSTQVAVPTLDVDLVWHTHQLAPPTYYAYSISTTDKFIDHDDKIDETKLSNSFEWTSKTYQKMFNEVYSECTCWYCEHPLPRLPQNLFHRHPTLHPPTPPSSPSSTPHISAHSAIKPTLDSPSPSSTSSSSDPRVRESLYRIKLHASYKKACHRARKQNRQVPDRDQYTTHAYAYGVPVYMPYYAPYMGDPCTGGMYAADPGCANFQVGAAGNCCQGSCVAGGGGGGGGGFRGCAGGGMDWAGAGDGSSGADGGCAGGGGGGCGGGGCGGGGGG